MRSLTRSLAGVLLHLPLCILPAVAQTNINSAATVTSTIGGVVNIGNLNTSPFTVTFGAGGSMPGSVFVQNRARLINTVGHIGDLSVAGLSRVDIEGTAPATVTTLRASVEAVANIAGQRSVDSIILDAVGNVNIAGVNLNGTPIRFLNRSTLALYGSGLTVTGVLGGGADGFGAYTERQVSGTLLGGQVLTNYPLYFYNGIGNVRLINTGGTQAAPMMPTQTSPGVFSFINVPTMRWMDPPLTSAFDFAMTDGDLFTTLTLPVGIDGDNALTIAVGNDVLGTFSSGATVNFADFGYIDGVSAFRVSGIDPLVDAGNGDAFPIQLGFNHGFASFTMSAVTTTAPEPGSVGLLLGGIGMFCGMVRRRRS